MWKPIDKPMVQPEHPLEAEILSLAAQSYKLAHDLLVKLREFDDAHGWDGFASCAHWLSFKTSLDMGAAREKVRAAHALKDLPKIAAKFAIGQLSYSKVRALTRIATPAIEADLLELAEAATVEQVERLVRGWREMNREGEKKRDAHRRCHISTDANGMCRVTALLRPEEGALLAKAIAAVRVQGQSLADAFVAMAERSVCASEQADGERYQVIVHQEEEGASVETRFGEKVRVSAEIFEQLSCDAATVEITHDSSGAVLDIGSKTRRISAKLRMALSQRDAGCRFPACTNQRVQMHHVQHWSHGGATNTSNLISLCAFHHGVIHREEARLGEDKVFRHADGRPITNALPFVADPVPRTNRTWTIPSPSGERLDYSYASAMILHAAEKSTMAKPTFWCIDPQVA